MKKLKAPAGYFAKRMAQKTGQSRNDGTLTRGKGEKGGNCNRTHCQKPASEDRDGIRWFNHSTRKYYCLACAWDLNEDRFNKADSQRIWGHNLCTLEA